METLSSLFRTEFGEDVAPLSLSLSAAALVGATFPVNGNRLAIFSCLSHFSLKRRLSIVDFLSFPQKLPLVHRRRRGGAGGLLARALLHVAVGVPPRLARGSDGGEFVKFMNGEDRPSNIGLF